MFKLGKQIVPKVVFEIRRNKGAIKFKEINIPLEDDDVIESGWDEGFYSENNSYEGSWYLKVTRQVLETTEEYETRRSRVSKMKEESRDRDLDHIKRLKLKYPEEFQGNKGTFR